jgi:hypothetical protein
VAVYRMEGMSHHEIAAQLGCVPRSVEHRLRVIRTIWARELSP